MTRAVYFDCFSGCAGDMIIGSLLDAGLDFEALRKGLGKLNLPGYHITMKKVERSSITATKFDVVMDDEHHHRHENDHHNHEDGHEHSHNSSHQHRGLIEILQIIEGSDIPNGVKKKSSEIFRKLGTVEAGIHGIPVEEVHFHELGAVDTIVDIVGTLLALEIMGVERVYSSPLAVGTGTVKTAHGVLPVPAPATLQILTEAGAPLTDAPAADRPSGELLTPTGAVLITSLVSEYRRPVMKPGTIGYGAGNKQFSGWPNVVRAWVGEESSPEGHRDMVLLETNIDDMSPQLFGYTMEKLLDSGAADVWFTPIHMKKNRPAVMLSILCSAEQEDEMTEIVMRETTTLGIRSRKVSRHVAQRSMETVETSLGNVPVKVKYFKDFVSVTPEYEDCRRIAQETGLSLQHVIRTVENEARNHLESH